MNKIILGVLIIFCVSCADAKDIIQIPSDWKKPTNKLFNGKWRKDSLTRFLEANGDYNGDKKIDYAYILECKSKKGMAIFVMLSQSESKYKLYKLFDTTTDDISLKDHPELDFTDKYFGFGIKTIPPGKYQPFSEGEGDESTAHVLKNDAIEFYEFDTDDVRIYFWGEKEKTFKLLGQD